MEAEKFLEEQDIFDFVPDGPAKFECKSLLFAIQYGIHKNFQRIDMLFCPAL